MAIFICADASARYTVDWHSVSGGGGTSTGGVYSVSGTIGQVDAGTNATSGGSYSVTGGFWSLLATVQTPGAPTLRIRLISTNAAAVYWQWPSTGFNLQQNSSLNTTNWTSISETVTNDGTNNLILVSPPTGNRFYRLYRPPTPPG